MKKNFSFDNPYHFGRHFSEKMETASCQPTSCHPGTSASGVDPWMNLDSRFANSIQNRHGEGGRMFWS